MLTRNSITKKLLFEDEEKLINHKYLIDWKTILISRFLSEITIKECIDCLPLKYVLKYQKLSKNFIWELRDYFREYIDLSPLEDNILCDMFKTNLKIKNPEINDFNINVICEAFKEFYI